MSNEPRTYADDIDLDAPAPVPAPEPRYEPAPPLEYEDAYPAQAPRRSEVGARPSRIPENAPRPQDHRPATASEDPSEPVMNEALGILTVTIEYDGMELELPSDPEDWPIKATRAFEQGKIITAVEKILSPKDFQKVLDKNYRNKEFGKLYEKLASAGGFGNAGN